MRILALGAGLLISTAAIVLSVRSRQSPEVSRVVQLIRAFDSDESYKLVQCRKSRVDWRYRKPIAELIEIGPIALPSLIDCFERPFSTRQISTALLQSHCIETVVCIGTPEAFRWLGRTCGPDNYRIFAITVGFIEAYRTHFEWQVPLDFLETVCSYCDRGPDWAENVIVAFDSLCQTSFWPALKEGGTTSSIVAAMKIWLTSKGDRLRWDALNSRFIN